MTRWEAAITSFALSAHRPAGADPHLFVHGCVQVQPESRISFWKHVITSLAILQYTKAKACQAVLTFNIYTP